MQAYSTSIIQIIWIMGFVKIIFTWQKYRPAYLLVQLQPRYKAFGIRVLETKEPDFSQSYRLHDLGKAQNTQIIYAKAILFSWEMNWTLLELTNCTVN